MNINELLSQMLAENASDLHISVQYPPMIRKHGELLKMNNDILKAEFVRLSIFSLLKNDEKKKLDKNLQLDLAIDLSGIGRFRVNVFHERHGLGITFRAISTSIKSIEELELPESLNNIASFHQGLVLVTGPTGSGKSTTLAAIVNQVNKNYKKHIITLEDPIEFIYEGINSEIHQRELGTHMHSFSDGLKAALREDPDIILVGELRDFDTISLALTAAETCHLVFGTLHTSSAIQTINRIIDIFPVAQQSQIRTQLAESIKVIIAQKLYPRTDKDGLIPVVEILIRTPAVSNLIREGKTFQIPSIIQTGLRYGMQSFKQSLQNLIKKEIISEEHINIQASAILTNGGNHEEN